MRRRACAWAAGKSAALRLSFMPTYLRYRACACLSQRGSNSPSPGQRPGGRGKRWGLPAQRANRSPRGTVGPLGRTKIIAHRPLGVAQGLANGWAFGPWSLQPLEQNQPRNCLVFFPKCANFCTAQRVPYPCGWCNWSTNRKRRRRWRYGDWWLRHRTGDLMEARIKLTKTAGRLGLESTCDRPVVQKAPDKP